MNEASSPITISFIILTWNSENYIGTCLDSLSTSLGCEANKNEVIIVDNGSSDNTLDILDSLKKRVPFVLKVISLDKNMGTTFPRNLAIKQARGQYLCVMDSDVEIFQGVLEKLISNMDSNPSVGLSVPKLMYPSGNLQKSTDAFPTILRKVYRYFFLKQIENRENQESEKTIPEYIDYAISALWLLRRETIDQVGLLDENIFYSPEDVDYCLRLWKKGLKILYDPTVSAVHHTQEISRGFKINAAFIHHIKGLGYYFLKHRYLFNRPRFNRYKRNTKI